MQCTPYINKNLNLGCLFSFLTKASFAVATLNIIPRYTCVMDLGSGLVNDRADVDIGMSNVR